MIAVGLVASGAGQVCWFLSYLFSDSFDMTRSFHVHVHFCANKEFLFVCMFFVKHCIHGTQS